MDFVGFDLLGPERDCVWVKDIVVAVGGVVGEVNGDGDNVEVLISVEL